MSIKPLIKALGLFTVTMASASHAFTFDYGANWRYQDTGSAPAQNWQQADFDDAAWKEGSGIFSYGFDHPVEGNTLLTDYNTLEVEGRKPSAYYFRKNITLNAEQANANLYLTLQADDAAAIYVNGQEVARSALLKRDEVLTNTTAPLRYSKYAADAEYTFVLPANLLQSGENTIAVSVFNFMYHRTNDALFNAKLSDSFTYSGDFDGPYVTHLPYGEIMVESLSKDGYSKEIFKATQKKSVTVKLPSQLGQFKVALQGEHTPPAHQYAKPEQYFVTSDFEGNIEALVYLLVQSGIMDKNYNWTYGKGHLYHLGDLFDRGAYVTESLWLFYHLETQAKQAGGDVHFILGNHDLMNFYGDFR